MTTIALNEASKDLEGDLSLIHSIKRSFDDSFRGLGITSITLFALA